MKKIISILFFLFISVHLFGQKDTIQINRLLQEASKVTIDNSQKGDSLYQEVVTLAIKNKYPKGKYYALRELAFIHYKNSEYKKAVRYFEEALENENFVKDRNHVGQTYFKLGTSNLFLGEHLNTTKAYLKTIDLFEETKDTANLIKVYDNFGVLYGNMDNYKKAEEYKIKTIALARKIKDTFLIASGSLNLGVIYAKTNRLDDAYEQYMIVKSLSKSLKSDRINHHLYKNIARYYSEKEDMNACLENALIADKYLRYSKNKVEKAYFEAFLGTIYQELKIYNKAEKHLLNSLNLSEEIESETLQLNSLNPLAEIFASKKDYKKAYNYAKKYYQLSEKTRSESNNKIVTELDTKYQTEKKDKEIIQQQLALEQKDKEIQKKKIQNNYMIGIASFLLLSSIFTWFLFQQRQKRKNQEIVTLKREHQIKSLEILIEGEEKERLRIAKELHDGVNGDLSAIKYKLTSMQEMSNKIINEAVEMIDKSCKQVRAISHNLIPPSLESFNVVEATETFCQNMNEIHSPKINFQHIGETPKINKKDEINIFRIIQELVTNSIKHAAASEIDVQLSCREKQVQITVEDNGKGFDKNTVKNDGIGLGNIQSRIDYLKATMDLLSNDKGTSYTIEIDTNKNDN